MRDKVKRCPFCNNHNLTLLRTQKVSNVQCRGCGATGPNSWSADGKTSDAEAVMLWNSGENREALVANRNSNHHELKEVDLD